MLLGQLLKAEGQIRPDEDDFYGARVGEFPSYAHGIQGTVFAVDEDTLFVKDFAYDGNAPGNDRLRSPGPNGNVYMALSCSSVNTLTFAISNKLGYSPTS